MKLSKTIDEYVAHKRALGMNFTTEVRVLGAFCRHVGNISMDSITKDQVQCYLDGDMPITRYWERKHTVLAGLYHFSLPRGYVKVSPLPSHHPQYSLPLIPYIYSQAELKRLLLAVPSVCSLRTPLDAYVLHTVILVLYGACLRISEALNLTMNDIDFGQSILCVRATKFYKTRFVPIGKDLYKVLCLYAQQRNATHCTEASEPFFCFRDGQALSQSAVRSAFRRLCVQTDVRRNDAGRYQPRLHDLRHTGVVHRLIFWYRQGIDLQQLLPQLATYLGHINLAATQRYLTLTPELLREASLRFEHYSKETHHE